MSNPQQYIMIFEDTLHSTCLDCSQSPCLCAVSSSSPPVLYSEDLAYLQRLRDRKQYGVQKFKKRKKKPLPPSQQAVVAYYQGEKAIGKILQTFFGRAVIIGTALALFGDKKALVRNSLVASASIEAFLLYWYKFKKHN